LTPQTDAAAPVTIKVGGSSMDLDFLEPRRNYIGEAAKHICDLANMLPVIVIPGSGPALDPRKTFRDKYGTSPEDYAAICEATLRLNAIELSNVLGKDRCVLVSPTDLLDVNPREIRRYRVHVMYCAPPQWQLSTVFSDLHTLALADHFGCETVVFLKDARGIYRWDRWISSPARVEKVRSGAVVSAPELDLIAACIDRGEPNAGPFVQVRVSQMIGPDASIYRIGRDGRTDHLIEGEALKFLQAAKHIQRVSIANIRTPHKLVATATGLGQGYSSIVKDA